MMEILAVGKEYTGARRSCPGTQANQAPRVSYVWADVLVLSCWRP